MSSFLKKIQICFKGKKFWFVKKKNRYVFIKEKEWDFVKKIIYVFVKKKKKEEEIFSKRIIPVLKKKKKKRFLVCMGKKNQICFLEINKKGIFLREDPHSWGKFIMHASHIKKRKRLQPNF